MKAFFDVDLLYNAKAMPALGRALNQLAMVEPKFCWLATPLNTSRIFSRRASCGPRELNQSEQIGLLRCWVWQSEQIGIFSL